MSKNILQFCPKRACKKQYANSKVVKLCREYGWKYIIRYKEGCAPKVEEDYEMIPEKEQFSGGEYVNGIILVNEETNVLKYREVRENGEKEAVTRFAWITGYEITKKNAAKIVQAGRTRWKIENQGFNRQKRWQGDIEHACSFHAKAQKNHYLMEQISDFVKQLNEYFFLKKNEIKKTQKNISSDLLQSFGRQLTREDISQSDTQSVSNN